MTRYYFHVTRSGTEIADDEGMELKTLAEVHNEAECSARELLAAAIISDTDPPTKITVYDEQRQKVADVNLGSLLPRNLIS